MAKDARGHGSDGRGGSFRDVASQHQMRVARSTVKMPAAIANMMGGMTAAEAHALIAQRGSVADKAMAAEYAKIPDNSAAASRLASGPKSARFQSIRERPVPEMIPAPVCLMGRRIGNPTPTAVSPQDVLRVGPAREGTDNERRTRTRQRSEWLRESRTAFYAPRH